MTLTRSLESNQGNIKCIEIKHTDTYTYIHQDNMGQIKVLEKYKQKVIDDQVI